MRACNRIQPRILSAISNLSFLALAIQPVLALHVVPGSNCTVLCSDRIGDFSNTTTEDITCYDKDYNSTDVGKRFQDCVACELQSETFEHGSGQTDLGWALCT